jgi:hypothetical protein
VYVSPTSKSDENVRWRAMRIPSFRAFSAAPGGLHRGGGFASTWASVTTTTIRNRFTLSRWTTVLDRAWRFAGSEAVSLMYWDVPSLSRVLIASKVVVLLAVAVSPPSVQQTSTVSHGVPALKCPTDVSKLKLIRFESVTGEGHAGVDPFWRLLRQLRDHAGRRKRAFRVSSPLRACPCRLISFSRVMWPSPARCSMGASAQPPERHDRVEVCP